MRAPTVLGCALAALLPAVPAMAADSARVERLLETMHMAGSMDVVRQQQLEAVGAQMMADCLKRGSTRARCEEAVPQLVAPVERAFAAAMTWDALRPDIVALYAGALTDAEVEAAIAHYDTPEGQALLTKLPVLGQRVATLGEQRVAAGAATLRRELAAVAAKLSAEDAARGAGAATAPAPGTKPTFADPFAPGAMSAPVEPLEPMAPAAPAEPAEAVEPARAAEPAAAVEPADAAEPAAGAEPAAAAEPAVVEEPAAASEPAVEEEPAAAEEPAVDVEASAEEAEQAADEAEESEDAGPAAEGDGPTPPAQPEPTPIGEDDAA
jgi:hypothetical protein